MKKIFVYVQKRFFVNNGTDYAAAIADEDIKVFARLGDACSYRQKEYDRIRAEMEFKRDWFTDGCFEIEDVFGNRVVLQILEKDIL